nr:hypothetical protein CFP56_71350 [Quercus suber]
MSRHLARRAPALAFQCERLALRPRTTTLRITQPSPPHHHHLLHTTALLRAGSSSSTQNFRQTSNVKNPSPKQAAAKQIAAAMRSGEGLNEDMGVMADTLIVPSAALSWRNRGIWSTLLRRWLRLRFTELASALLYAYWSVRPRPPLEWGSVAGTAQRLHREMYEAFAAGELQGLKSKVCVGLWKKLDERVRARPKGVRLRWKVERYVRRPSVMSFKAGLMNLEKKASKEEQLGMKQAVVRIHSVQSLQHVRLVTVKDPGGSGTSSVREVLVDAMGKPLEEGETSVPVTKESVEYLVVQKLLINSREKDWKIWGTTKETPMESFHTKPVKQMVLPGSNSS